MRKRTDVTPNGQEVRSRRYLIAALTVWGLIVGTIGYLGWRFATPLGQPERTAGPGPSTPPAPGDVGYMIVVDHSEYASGPAWWPLIVLLPAVGGLIGMATGFAITAATRRTSQMSSRVAIGAGFVVTGGVIGLATALIGKTCPPRQMWSDMLEPTDTYVDPMSALYLPPHRSGTDLVELPGARHRGKSAGRGGDHLPAGPSSARCKMHRQCPRVSLLRARKGPPRGYNARRSPKDSASKTPNSQNG